MDNPLQSIPRQIWLDRNGKQLVQWPVEELNSLRDNEVYVYGKQLESGSVFEVSGITASQVSTLWLHINFPFVFEVIALS